MSKLRVRAGRGPGLAAALFYGLTSVSMAFLNKAVVTSYDFNYPFFIMSTQMIITIGVLEGMAWLNLISLPRYTWKTAKDFIAPSSCFAVHATLSLMALRGMNIPMYGAVKRCTPLVNLILSVVLLRKPPPSTLLTVSILSITLGCLLAGFGDLTFESWPYFMGGLSVIAQGLYQTLIQRCSENHISVLEILQLNSYNTLAPFVLLSLACGEPANIVGNPFVYDWGFHAVLWTLVTMGAVLNYSLFLCTALNCALTTSLVGVAKSVLQTFIGFFTFGGVPYSTLNISGITLNTLGGFMYSYAKYVDKKDATTSVARRESHSTRLLDSVNTDEDEDISEIKVS